MKMKVYHWNHDGRRQRLVAARSYAEAALVGNTTPHNIKTYGSITGNPDSVALAMEEPGTLWERSCAINSEWKKVGA